MNIPFDFVLYLKSYNRRCNNPLPYYNRGLCLFFVAPGHTFIAEDHGSAEGLVGHVRKEEEAE